MNLSLDRWARWICPECGDDQVAPNQPADPRCHDCAQVSRTRRLGRSKTLGLSGVPQADRLVPFVAPTAWPRDARSGLDPEAWLNALQPNAAGFVGDVGTGKTQAAIELLWRARQRGLTGFYLRADDLVRATFSGDARKLHKAKHTGFLVLDDLGRGHGDVEPWRLLDEVIGHRHAHGLRLLWTANLKLSPGRSITQDLYTLNAAVADRLVSGCLWPMVGTSKRQGVGQAQS